MHLQWFKPPTQHHSFFRNYCISSPIGLVIFSVFDTEVCEIFCQKWGSAYSRGFGFKKKIAEFSGFTFFLDNMSPFEGL